MSIMDTCAAAVNGAATGATPAAEARAMIQAQLTALVTDMLMLAPVNLSALTVLHDSYGITLDLQDGYIANVRLN